MAQSKQCSLVGSLTVGVALAVFTLCGQAAAQATIPAPGFQPSGLAFDGTFLYVLELSGVRTIFKLDPQTGACLDSFVLGNNPDGLAFDGSSRLFVSDISGTPDLCLHRCPHLPRDGELHRFALHVSHWLLQRSL